jgi:nickel/cobalt transporter (NicO) family protein
MNLVAGLTAFFLGTLHALEPGHGKSAIVAYAVERRNNILQVIVLGLSAAVTHTVMILTVAIIIGGAISTIAGETMRSYIEAGSALLLIGTGLWLWKRPIKRSLEKDCLDVTSTCACHNHTPNESGSLGVAGLLGISAGLLPCPTMLAVLLSAMTSGHFIYGLWTVCLFSIGIAITMCGVAWIAMFWGRSLMAEKMKNYISRSSFANLLPNLSSWIIIASGVITLFRLFCCS